MQILRINASISTLKMSFRENLEGFLAHAEHVRNLLARGEDGYQQEFTVRVIYNFCILCVHIFAFNMFNAILR